MKSVARLKKSNFDTAPGSIVSHDFLRFPSFSFFIKITLLNAVVSRDVYFVENTRDAKVDA